ncbi:MAG TPA: metalloregulator ArsR/SmtB family transcription factor [bacterium]|jgi:DNA-binding transcriptional ArsR family regulator|nr:metalloregulator ArsR/SmtB family transcription factor [bacterium]
MNTLDFTFKIKADFLAVLAHPARLQLLEALRSHGKTVGALALETQLSQPVTSKHLTLLRQAGILASEQQGKTVTYRVADPGIFAVLRTVNTVLLAQMRRTERDLKHLALPLAGRHPKGGRHGAH